MKGQCYTDIALAGIASPENPRDVPTTEDIAKMARHITPLCRISYPHIFTPKRQTQKDRKTGEEYTTEKYQAALLFDESAAEGLKKLKQDAIAEGKAEFGEHFEAMVKQGSIRWPFRDGGAINPNTGQPFFGDGITFINVSSHDKPDVVSRYAAPGETKPRKIDDPSELWPGEYVKASVMVKPYNRKDAKGIAVYINALQLWHEGERLDNRVSGQDAFDAEGEQPAAEMEQPPEYQEGTQGGTADSLL